MRIVAPFAMAAVLAVTAAFTSPATAHAPRRSKETHHRERKLETASVPNVAARASWAEELRSVAIFDRNSGAFISIRLYASDGSIDDAALHAFEEATGGNPIDRRLAQLVFRAAYHFDSPKITVTSATRKGARGKHGDGSAMDFELEGVKAADLAAYLRTIPCAGVGYYPHPKTQYAHLDVREHSYHWVDWSPPGVTWREKLLEDKNQAARDASYSAAADLPEH